MKTCNEIQRLLRDRFDLGEDVTEVADDHLNKCVDCRAYRAELAALATELAVLTLEPSPENLTARITMHVRTHGFDGGLQWRDYITLAGVAAVASIAAGWYAPTLFDVTGWWTEQWASLPQLNMLFADGLTTRWADAVRSAVDSAQASVPVIPQTIVWPALAVSCACAVAFNAFFAFRFRTAGD